MVSCISIEEDSGRVNGDIENWSRPCVTSKVDVTLRSIFAVEEPGEMVSFKIRFSTMWCFLQGLILAKSFILEDSEGIDFKMVKFSEDGDDGNFEEKHS